MGSSGGGGGGGLAALLQQNPDLLQQHPEALRDQLAMLQQGGGDGGAPNPVQPIRAPGGGGMWANHTPQMPVNMQNPGGGFGNTNAPAPWQPGVANPNGSDGSRMGFGGGGFDYTDPRYTSRVAEGSGPSAARPDMSAMMNARAAAPPTPPPLPYGMPFPWESGGK